MCWHGVVVSEALTDETVVNRLRVTGARIDGGRHRYWVVTGRPGVELVRRHLRPGPWYAHFWTDRRLLVVFADACFELPGGASAADPGLLAHAARQGLPPEALELSTAPPPDPGPAPGLVAVPVADPDSGPARPEAAAAAASSADLRLVLADEEVDALLDSLEEQFFGPLSARHPEAGPRRALAALRAVREALGRPRPARVLAPNGRWVHAGLQLAALAPADLEALHAALRGMSAALVGAAAPGDPYAAGLSAPAARAGSSSPRALTGALARLLAVVDLPPDEDTRLLAAALHAAPADDLVLDAAQEQAFQRLAHRVSMLLSEADPLHRFLLHPDQPGG